MSLAVFGAAIVTLAWVFQLLHTWKGQGINKLFLAFYGIGVALNVVEAASGGFDIEGWMSLLVLLLVGLIYLKMTK